MANSPRKELLEFIDPEWFAVGNDYLRHRHLNPLKFSAKVTHELLPKHLANIATDGLARQIEERKALGSQKTIAGILGVHRTTLYRRATAKTTCNLKGYLAALLYLGWELPAFHGSHEAVVFELTARLLHAIREDDLQQPCQPPSRTEAASVHFFARYPDSWKWFPDPTQLPQQIRVAAYTAVWHEVTCRVPDAAIEVTKLPQIISDWCEPYTLFRVALAEHDWDLFDEDTV